MSPKEKAKIIIDVFEDVAYSNLTDTNDGVEVHLLARESAIAAVDCILDEVDWIGCPQDANWIEYWQEVKREISLL